VTEPSAVWLYAVARDVDGRWLARVTGVDGEPVRTVHRGELTAVVGSVSPREYGEEALRRNFEDLDWLGEKARVHDAVVQAAVRAGTTVPLRFATVCHDDRRVRSLLAERRLDFEAALARVAGRAEWGVKGYADPDVPAQSRGSDSIENTRVGAGAAYLSRRRAQLSAKEDRERQAAAFADDAHVSLMRLAVAGRRHPAQHRLLSGTRDWMVLNGTYLVEDDRAEEFAATVEELRDERGSTRLELTGPWPPYSFTGIDES
jgi:hypothetical protein